MSTNKPEDRDVAAVISEMFFTLVGALISIALLAAIIAGIASYYTEEKSCLQQYRDAWSECNDDYNGKCRYLGEKYNPHCLPDDGEEADFE